MDRISESFFVDWKSKTIYSHTVWCRRFIKDLTPQETETIILHDSPEILINSQQNFLTPIANEEIKSFWESDLMDRIAYGENWDIQEFERGCCFTAELWKGKYGKKIIILKYHH